MLSDAINNDALSEVNMSGLRIFGMLKMVNWHG